MKKTEIFQNICDNLVNIKYEHFSFKLRSFISSKEGDEMELLFLTGDLLHQTLLQKYR